jgi:hypothetical protein
MPQRRKRTYTFRKGEMIPYESGSLVHEEVKTQREIAKNFESAFGEPRKRRRK